MMGNNVQAQNASGNYTYVLPNSTISVNQTTGVDLDFTKLRPGTYALIEMYDSHSRPFKFKVERKEDLKLAVSADTSTLTGITSDTTINFIGKGKLLRSVNLTELSNQRCGLFCILIHACCVHIHIGPPGNTWEWSCSNCQGGIE